MKKMKKNLKSKTSIEFIKTYKFRELPKTYPSLEQDFDEDCKIFCGM